MTENDKRLTPAHADLDGRSLCPEPERGQEWTQCDRAVLGHWSTCHHTWPHQCTHNENLEELARATAGFEKASHLVSGGHLSYDEASLEYWASRRIHALAKAMRTQTEHNAWKAHAEREHARATNKANAESKRGPWEFTLTYSPKEHGWNREEAKDAMRTACERLIRYYREEVEEFHAVGELTTSGQPHVHAWYKLDGGRRITTKSFKRAYPIWDEKRKLGNGHVGGHHAPVKRTSDFAGYIEKDLDTSWLILNITNAPEADVQEAHESEDEVDDASQDSTPGSPRDAQPDDGQLRQRG